MFKFCDGNLTGIFHLIGRSQATAQGIALPRGGIDFPIADMGLCQADPSHRARQAGRKMIHVRDRRGLPAEHVGDPKAPVRIFRTRPDSGGTER